MRHGLVVALMLSAALFGCGDDDDDGGNRGGSSGGAAATVELEESEFRIEPSDVNVDQAGLVEFRIENTGQTAHALEVEGSEGESETEEFGPGETATLEVQLDPGEYEMYCPVGDHRDRGMTGTIRVADSAGGGDGETETEQEDEGGSGSAPGY